MISSYLKSPHQLLFTVLLLLLPSLSHAEVNISGYASIVAGKVIDGDEFLADFPKTGLYDTDISFSPDTSIGIQLSSELNDQIDFIIQAVGNSASDYDVDLDWAYLTYHVSHTLSVQAGRKRLPLYYYSDFFDVGYAYHWIRPPSDNYTWQISNYNGLSIQYQPVTADWDILLSLYTGREDSKQNDLLSLLFDAPTNETWKNMVGLVTEASRDWFEIRATYMEGELDREINNISVLSNIRQKFSGVSINLYPGNLIILTEFNQYKRPENDIDVTTSLISFAYQVGDFIPFVSHSAFKQSENLSGGDEEHETFSLGLRWDFNKSTAFKVQYDDIEDHGINIPLFGNSKALSLGVDIVF